MQRRKRESQITTTINRNWSRAFASFQIAVLAAIFASCATTERTPKISLDNPQLAMQNAMRALTLSGEGKGQLSTQGKKNSFSFAIVADDAKWMLGVSLPLIGEEVLELQYSPFRASGSIYDRMTKDSKEKEVNSYLRSFSEGMRYLSSIQKTPGQCSAKKSGNMVVGKCGSRFTYNLFAEKMRFKFVYNGYVILGETAHFNGAKFQSLNITTPNLVDTSLILRFR